MGHYDSPEYSLIEKEEHFELREYPSFYMVEYDNDLDPEIEYGFNTLFSYIGSNNSESKKISMTVPVIEEIDAKKKKMAFVVPKDFGDRIPQPQNSHLKVVEFPSGYYAVIIYSGRSNQSIEEKQATLLHEWIKSKNWKEESKDKLAFYNAPFIPGIFRRNEIMVKISK